MNDTKVKFFTIFMLLVIMFGGLQALRHFTGYTHLQPTERIVSAHLFIPFEALNYKKLKVIALWVETERVQVKKVKGGYLFISAEKDKLIDLSDYIFDRHTEKK